MLMSGSVKGNYELLGSDAKGIAALGLIRPRGGQAPAEMEVLVRPDSRGQWEQDLVGALLSRNEPSHPYLKAEISVTHPEAATALEAHGFRLLRVLDEMVLVL